MNQTFIRISFILFVFKNNYGKNVYQPGGSVTSGHSGMVSSIQRVAYFLKSEICDYKCFAFVKKLELTWNCNIYSTL